VTPSGFVNEFARRVARDRSYRTCPQYLASRLAALFGIQGPTATIQTACTSSAQAIGEAYRAIRRGTIDLALAGGAECIVSPIEVQLFCLLGVMSPKRLEKFPDVPNYRELGIDVDFIFWRGLFVHKDTPPAIVKVLRDAVTRVANAPGFKATMEKGNFTPAAVVSDAETQVFLTKEERMVQEVLANLASKPAK